MLTPMLSHAQNAEDVVLRRVFADVETGFYVDVGASSPVDDSVTLHFYEQGWRGVNIEPDPDDYAQLAKARPRDINLNAAVGTGAEPLRFAPPEIRGHGTVSITGEGIEVAQISLDEIFSTYAPESGVHFLKVDVEGWEREVLASASFDRFRPQVVLVEAVDASGAPTHEEWEPGLLGAGYRFGLFDGLNRFYCREEDAERLVPRLAAPASVLDNWRPEREAHVQRALEAAVAAERTRADAAEAEIDRLVEEQARAVADAEALRHELDHARQQHAAVAARLAEAEARAASDAEAARQELERARLQHGLLAARLDAVQDSTSWRVTGVLRDVSRLSKLLRRGTEI